MYNLITDRTEADVNELLAIKQYLLDNGYDPNSAEGQAFLQDSKGAYNASDLTRVSQALHAIALDLKSKGNTISETIQLLTWDPDTVYTTEFQNYINSVEAIRAVWNLPRGTPQTPNMDNLTYEGANNIEKILLAVATLSENISYVYSNDCESGEW